MNNQELTPASDQVTAPAPQVPRRAMIVTQYFPPEVGAPQARLSEFAGAWQASGLDVTVLTGMPNHPTGVKPHEYRRAIRRIEQRNGYKVIRTWLYATPNEGIIRKTLSHISFAVSAAVFGSRSSGNQDVVVVSSPTFFAIGTAALLAKLKRARFVVEIRDLWPAVFIELGVIRSRTLIRILEALELAAYHHADAVVVVSDGFREHISARGVPTEKITVIPNGVDLHRFTLQRTPKPRRSSLGCTDNETLVLYIGAHGISQGLGTILQAAQLLNSEAIHFAFVGDGAQKSDLERQVQEARLTNVSFFSSVNSKEVPGIIAAADICLVPLRNIPLFQTFIPSKMFEFLAMERAVIGSLTGEAALILKDAGGSVVAPEDSEALAEEIRRLAANPALRVHMGQKGREFVQNHFNRQALAQRYVHLLEQVVSQR